ncbi:C-type mannose receptor 2-like [Mizuhopecten yessoensis]|uniref:C-type mannose receptor 2-like n=1 Tax=Mizuhopecten yessoensis TaxID=6573 RepID=UPI000B45A0F8|nr:C-type mannose receptor 2-like [Mizuhopecten yessoensis]
MAGKAGTIDCLTCCVRAGYVLLDDGPLCVKKHDNALTWNDAKTQCEQDHGRLAVIDNAQKFEAFVNYLENITSAVLWIGINDKDSDGSWVWLNGASLITAYLTSYQINNYSSGYSGNKYTADCAWISEDGHLADDNCLMTKSYMCCVRAGFEFLQDGHICVKIFTDAVDWDDAKASCEMNHGRLVIIDTEQKLNALSEYLGNMVYDHERLWIGATDSANEGNWVWLNGEGVDQTYWDDVKLNDFCIERLFANSADCGRIVDKDLSDDHCSLDQKYVCERTDIV